jgi:hypothetical protein
MSARKLKPSELPHWPRWLNRSLAAAYVGVSPDLFEIEVSASIWPQPRLRGLGVRRPLKTWDRAALDLASDGDTRGVPNDLEQRRAAADARRKAADEAASADKKPPHRHKPSVAVKPND